MLPLIALLIEQGEIERALEYLQRSNNDELRERFGALERNIGDTTRRKILDQDRLMKARLAWPVPVRKTATLPGSFWPRERALMAVNSSLPSLVT